MTLEFLLEPGRQRTFLRRTRPRLGLNSGDNRVKPFDLRGTSCINESISVNLISSRISVICISFNQRHATTKA